jgi:mono/diheme cytochrome c family protein
MRGSFLPRATAMSGRAALFTGSYSPPGKVNRDEPEVSLPRASYPGGFCNACGSAAAKGFLTAFIQKAVASSAKQPAAKKQSAHADNGLRIFDQNCSRCHAEPDGFSSRISDTVLRHMRIRASLSQHDEQELLRFLNP